MQIKRKMFAVAVGLCVHLFFATPIHAEIMRASDHVLPLEMLIPVFGRPLVLVSISPVVVRGETIGAVTKYHNPATRRSVDYLEICDNEGHVVAVGWFDRFGIRRVALDRALLDHGDEPAGIFVSFLEGDQI